jgi:hypothetical protein
MVNVVKGGGRAPPPAPAWANFTLMTECTPDSDCCYSMYSVVKATAEVLSPQKRTSTLRKMKFLIFFYFCGSFLPSWIRIRITNPELLTWLNPDPIRIHIRIRNTDCTSLEVQKWARKSKKILPERKPSRALQSSHEHLKEAEKMESVQTGTRQT